MSYGPTQSLKCERSGWVWTVYCRHCDLTSHTSTLSKAVLSHFPVFRMSWVSTAQVFSSCSGRLRAKKTWCSSLMPQTALKKRGERGGNGKELFSQSHETRSKLTWRYCCVLLVTNEHVCMYSLFFCTRLKLIKVNLSTNQLFDETIVLHFIL